VSKIDSIHSSPFACHENVHILHASNTAYCSYLMKGMVNSENSFVGAHWHLFTCDIAYSTHVQNDFAVLKISKRTFASPPGSKEASDNRGTQAAQ
jgi:hypothetical protein